MFKPFYGQCPQCPPGSTAIIPTKRGLCQKHLHAFKQEGKAERKGITIEQMQKAGKVQKAVSMVQDYKAEADRLFSIWIRRRWADVNGKVSCITCGTPYHWKRITNGHYVKRVHLGTRFNEKNCGPQCYDCQREIETNKELELTFADKLMKMYGPDVLEELEVLKNTITKISQEEYRDMCEEFKLKINNL